jgi:hypothetical protein
MADGSPARVKAGDEVRVHYHPPGQVVSFVEGVVSRVNVTTARGPGFLIDITRDVFLGREQPVRPGYQHYVLYERLEDFPGEIEMVSEVHREPADHPAHGSGPKVEQEPEADLEAVPEPEPKLLTKAEPDAEEPVAVLAAEADGTLVQVERDDPRRRGSLIASIFGRQK